MTNPNGLTSDRNIGHSTPSASPLDEDRLASMADEGSVSGALMEIEDSVERRRLIVNRRRSNFLGGWRAAAAVFVFVGLAVAVRGWLKRNA